MCGVYSEGEGTYVRTAYELSKPHMTFQTVCLSDNKNNNRQY